VLPIDNTIANAKDSSAESNGLSRKDGTPPVASDALIEDAQLLHDDPTSLDPTVVSEAPREDTQLLGYLLRSVTEYAIVALSPDGAIVTWNAGAQRTFGYSAREILGKQFDVLFTAEEIAASQPQKELAVALRQGRLDRDCWHLRADGTRFWATNTIQPMCDDNGSVTGFCKIVRDSTERFLAAQALRESEDRLRCLVESVEDYALFSLLPSGDVTLWNTGAERTFGYTAAEMIGSHVSRLFAPPEAGQGNDEVVSIRGESHGGATSVG
jgi:PAS domain S-box-containing protein